MTVSPQSGITLTEGRFARLEKIEWWDQALLRRARVLVVGAGALGNEVIKNLALVGVGKLAIVDMDRVELSNLSRSVLFRESDEGRPKAECAAREARALYPDLHVRPIIGNVLSDVGLGYFRWAQVVVGALDNREARVFLNSACARVGRPWIDGGLEILRGVARGFAPPATSCYECTMSQVDWDLLNKRRSCSLLARQALDGGGTPTTPTTASVVGALQAQEAIKLLHGMDASVGRGIIFDGTTNEFYPVTYPINPDCPWHGPLVPIESLHDATSDTALCEIWKRATRRLGNVETIDLSRELVEALECPSCKRTETILKPVDRIGLDQILCKKCGSECSPRFLHSIRATDDLLNRTPRAIGLPTWDILWARQGEQCLGIEIAGDNDLE